MIKTIIYSCVFFNEKYIDLINLLLKRLPETEKFSQCPIDNTYVINLAKDKERMNTVSKELRRDLLLLAKANPKLFISLAADENVQLRNFAINAVEQDIIRISPDQRTIHWSSNDRKLMNVPFDENPYSAIAAWFKTDEGVEVFKSIEKRLQ